MLNPTTTTLRPAAGQPPSGGYFLSEVALDIPAANTAVFRARLNAPSGAKVWARAWLSNELDGTLAETASECLTAGKSVTLTVKLNDRRSPEIGCIRIESAPLATEHVVIIKLSLPEPQSGGIQ
jgi:hypothetical protein